MDERDWPGLRLGHWGRWYTSEFVPREAQIQQEELSNATRDPMLEFKEKTVQGPSSGWRSWYGLHLFLVKRPCCPIGQVMLGDLPLW